MSSADCCLRTGPSLLTGLCPRKSYCITVRHATSEGSTWPSHLGRRNLGMLEIHPFSWPAEIICDSLCIFTQMAFFFFFLLYEPPWPEAPGESLFNKPHKKFARNFCVLPESSHPLTHIPFKPAGGSQREPKPLSPDRQRGDSRKACRCSGESGRQAHPAFRRPRALTRRHVSLFSGEQTWKPAMMWHCSVCSGSGIGKARKELPSCPRPQVCLRILTLGFSILRGHLPVFSLCSWF